MIFTIDQQIFDIFPKYIVAIVVGNNINNTESDKKIDVALASSIEHVKTTFPDANSLNIHKNIIVWRDAFIKAGVNPKNFLSSIEAMTTRIIKKGDFPKINKVVDLVNSVALSNLVPIGAHDIDLLSENFCIRFSKEGDIFTPMGGKTEIIKDKEIVYADDTEIRTRKWIWRQGDKAKITPESKNIFFPVDGFDDINQEDVLNAQLQLKNALDEIFEIDSKLYLVDKKNRSINI